MAKIDWKAEVEKRKDTILADLQGLLQIPSVLDEAKATAEAPFGAEVKRALDYMLELGQRDGFATKNTGHVAGHLETGKGKGLNWCPRACRCCSCWGWIGLMILFLVL